VTLDLRIMARFRASHRAPTVLPLDGARARPLAARRRPHNFGTYTARPAPSRIATAPSVVTRSRLCGAPTGLEQVGDVGKCHLDASVTRGLSSTLPSKSTLDAQSATGTVIAWKKPNSGWL
jgi:hypothetical protein